MSIPDIYLLEQVKKDKKLKKSLILSYNYKLKYLKKKYIHSSGNIKNSGIIIFKSNLKKSKNNVKPKKKHKNSEIDYNNDNSNYNKNDITNGGDYDLKFSNYDVNTNDNINNNNNNNKNIVKYNSNESDITMDKNFISYKYKSKSAAKSENDRRKKYLNINLKKFMNFTDNDNLTNNNLSSKIDYFKNLNKTYYSCSPEKKLCKLNLNQLNKNIHYLKLNNDNIHLKPKNKRTKSSYIKSPSINFFIENKSTLNYSNTNNTYKILSKENTEQFHMVKTLNKKFENLKEDDNILLNYYPNSSNNFNKNTLTINSNQIEYNIINTNIKKENKENKEIKEIIIKNPNSRQFNKFKEKLKLHQNNKKVEKIKISNKIKNLALGLENHMKSQENGSNLDYNDFDKDKNIIKDKEINKDINDNYNKIPIIYKKKKRTKIIFNEQ